MKLLNGRNDKGFTLIESIITIVAAAILGVMVFIYSNTSLIRSAQPLNQSTKAFALQKVMENIFADYNKNYKSNLVGIQTAIGGGVAGGNEGAILSNSYGQYTIVYNRFIKLQETDPDNSILKVTIKNDLGETLSILLTLIIT